MPRIRALVIALLTLASSEALATQVFHVPLDQMSREAQVIVRGRVVGQSVEWNDAHSRILTLTTLEVSDGIKGAAAGDILTIYQVGGTLDGVNIRVPGALGFRPQEDIVFFAMRFRDRLVSYGMGLGKYLVVDRAGRPFVEPELGDVSFVERTPDGRWVPAEPPPSFSWPLERFVAEVRAALTTGGRP